MTDAADKEIAMLRGILEQLVDTIENTGSPIEDDGSQKPPENEDEGIDMGLVYLAACKALNRKPLIDVAVPPTN